MSEWIRYDALAFRVAEPEEGVMQQEPRVLCVICGHLIPTKRLGPKYQGRDAHNECVVAKFAKKTSTRSPKWAIVIGVIIAAVIIYIIAT